MAAKVYMREDASGNPRPIGVWGTFLVNTIGYAPGLVIAGAPFLLGSLYPNANIYWVLTLGVILSVFNGLTYGLFSTAIDRGGGDFLFIGKTLRPSLGFVCNWGFWWSQILGLGVYTAQCVTDALSPALTTFGYATGSKDLIALGGRLAGGPVVWLIGTVLLFTVYLACISRMKTLLRFLNVLFVVACAGTLCMMLVFLGTSREAFVAEFNRFMVENGGPADAYATIVAMGQAKGLQTGQPTDLLSAVLALPIGYWVFIGFTYSAYVGGEVREPQRSQTIGMIGALVIGYGLYMLVLGRYYDVVGRDFNNAMALVKGDDDSPVIGGGSMAFMAGILAKNPLLSLMISLSTFLWFYLLLFVMALICVRMVHAWSFYEVMPKWLVKLSEGTGPDAADAAPRGVVGRVIGAIRGPFQKSGQPVRATLLIVLMAEAFLAAHAFLGIQFINYIAIFSVCFLIAGVAAVLFPVRRPDLFRAAPAAVQARVAGVPLISIAGAGNVVLFAIVLYSALTNPTLSGVEGLTPSIVLVVVYALGFLTYAVARRVRRAKGIDIDRKIREE